MAGAFWHINSSSLFDKLTEAQLAKLESRARLREFPKGSSVYLPADEATSVLLLVEGRVRIGHLTPDGKQAILAFVEPGEIFGEMALLGEPSRAEHAETTVPSRIVSLPIEAFESVMAESPNLSLGVTKLIGLRRRRVERRLQSLMFRSNRDRLVQLLVDLLEQYGQPDREGTLIGIKLSHQELANIIGSTRETVTVLLGQLQLERFLRVSRQRIVVREPEKLGALLNGQPLADRRTAEKAVQVSVAKKALRPGSREDAAR